MRMNGRLKKIILLLVAVALLAGGGRVQLVLNRDRDQLGLTRVAPLRTRRLCWRSRRWPWAGFGG